MIIHAFLISMLVILPPLSTLESNPVLCYKFTESSAISGDTMIDLKCTRSMNLVSTVKVFPYSHFIFDFTVSDNDISELSLEACSQVFYFSTSLPEIEISFIGDTSVEINIETFYSTAQTNGLSLKFNFTGTYGIVQLKDIHTSEIILNLSQNRNLLFQRLFEWNLYGYQTWGKIVAKFPLFIPSPYLNKYGQFCMQYELINNSRAVFTELSVITLKNTMKIAKIDKISLKLTENLVSFQLTFSPDPSLLQAKIIIKMVLFGCVINSSTEDGHPLDNIPFLPAWITIPVGIFLLLLPLITVSKKSSSSNAQLVLESKNFE